MTWTVHVARLAAAQESVATIRRDADRFLAVLGAAPTEGAQS